MLRGWEILVGAALIAGAIIFVGRWQIATGPGITSFRLDRWTGSVDSCVPQTYMHLKCGNQ
jgi:hypothetical protein